MSDAKARLEALAARVTTRDRTVKNASQLATVWARAVGRFYPRTYTPPPTRRIAGLLARRLRAWPDPGAVAEFLEWTVAHWSRLGLELKRDKALDQPAAPDLDFVLRHWDAYRALFARGLDSETSEIWRKAQALAAKEDLALEEALVRLVRRESPAPAPAEPARVELRLPRDDAAYILGRAEALAKRLDENLQRLIAVGQRLWLLARRGEDPGEPPEVVDAAVRTELAELVAFLRGLGGSS